jgi:hypothetical protein
MEMPGSGFGEGEMGAVTGGTRHDGPATAEAADAVEFAIRFMEGFEDDPEQEGLKEALEVLRRARTPGYRMVLVP